MMRGPLLVAVALALSAVLVGCGGSSSSPTTPAGNTGGVKGALAAAVNPQDYSIYVDGKKLAATPAADGSFELPQLPVGRHMLALIDESGMVGTYLPIEVDSGETVDVGDITPLPTGQIVGTVMKRGADGDLTPLAGVEVLADPNVYVIMGGAEGVAPGADGSMRPDIYPSPPRDAGLVQCTAITDEAGHYVMPGVAPGEYTVTVSVPGLEQGVQWVWVTSGEEATADFQLLEAVDPGVGTVRGTVLGKTEDGGRAPLQGALVTITLALPWEPPLPLQPTPAPSDAVARHPLPAQAGDDPGGVPIICPPPYRFEQFQTLTDRNGQWSLNVPSGHLNVSIWAEGYEGSWQEIRVEPDATVTVDATLELWTYVEPPVPEPGLEPEPVPPTDPVTGTATKP